MSGKGQAPFRSAWLWPPRTRLRRADAMFHQNINFSDPDKTEATIWTTWYFGAPVTTTFQPAWAAGANLLNGAATGT
jgi:hypothetical protein